MTEVDEPVWQKIIATAGQPVEIMIREFVGLCDDLVGLFSGPPHHLAVCHYDAPGNRRVLEAVAFQELVCERLQLVLFAFAVGVGLGKYLKKRRYGSDRSSMA
jgi:hypothetical protein